MQTCENDTFAFVMFAKTLSFFKTHARFSKHTAECDFYTQSVISACTSVIRTRRLWFLHTEYALTRIKVISTRRVWFPYAECDSDTHESDTDTHECYFYTITVISTRKVWFIHEALSCVDTHECDSHTQSLIFTRRVWFWYTPEWLWHAWVLLLHEKCDLYTKSVMFTRKVWFRQAFR
jgi:hypothetical protein